MKTILIFVLFTGCSFISKNKNKCSRLNQCLEVASKLTGKTYIYEGLKLDTKIETIGEQKWKRETADSIISELLAISGYARLHTKESNTYFLIPSRDIRYDNTLPSFSATKNENDPLPLPNSAEYAQLVYKTKKNEMASQIARDIRIYTSRYGRINHNEQSGAIIIRDNMTTIHNLLELIRKLDAP